ncbi:sensor histidine kinase [Streptomyces sp. CB03238]|uniref:sensor histidine kinase n=1 Tax=Streptomyces sp. CB03238 TaxID=1907777 RepID=UPI000A10CABE|nr:sensor histidine kinase [Streptomyces sp. CB03238]ORT57466.1 sensor histidine kinase [Streptomyces sp. CB03238]
MTGEPREDGEVPHTEPSLPDERPVAVWEAVRRRPLRFLLSGWPLRSWGFLLSGALFGLGILVALIVLVSVGMLLSVIGVGLLLLTGAVLLGLPVARAERRRLHMVDPVRLTDPHGSLSGVSTRTWLRARLTERATWRELAYTALLAIVFSGAGLGVAVLLASSVILLVSPLIVWLNAPGTVNLIPGQAIPHPLAALPYCVAGIAGFALSAYAAALVTGAQVRTARLLLSPRDEQYKERVIELTRSRVRLADAFEAERRRIERDLHDGAQQQLVALTMTLGLAEMELDGDNTAAAQLMARGRGEARQALDQLRALVRGIHPQVLTDHGLAAAVSEVALRSPIPVTVDIDIEDRLPGLVETTAYFTITEALTNAAKHSAATKIAVVGRREGGRLILLVTDDGQGGADPRRGTGLSGLADRVAILKGRLVVSSPLGGPTQVRMEVPCSG